MIWLRQSIFLVMAVTAVFAVCAQNLPSPVGVSDHAVSTSSATLESPVAFFRNLLAMSSEDRAHFLTNRPPTIRARILVKVNEYESLDPNERELRLRATELRWYLMPMLQMASTNRNEQLAGVPDDLRDLIKDRLSQWDILPPDLKQEFLENDRTMYYFARINPPGSPAALNLTDMQQQQISGQFNQFFELTPAEKQATLKTLSAAERTKMEKTLQSFEQLPSRQKSQCINNYAKFAGMNVAERTEFLKNAERWSQMSPAERQTWRDLVSHVPEWPPLPAAIFPQNAIQPVPLTNARSLVATNLD